MNDIKIEKKSKDFIEGMIFAYKDCKQLFKQQKKGDRLYCFINDCSWEINKLKDELNKRKGEWFEMNDKAVSFKRKKGGLRKSSKRCCV